MTVSPQLTIALLCALLVPASLAKAGPVEKFTQLALHPNDPNTLVLRYENAGDGLFYSHDGGKSFELVCGSLVDPDVTRFGVLAIAGDGSSLLGAFDGLWRGEAQGCSWQSESSLQGKWVSDLSNDPNDASVMYAITSTGAPAANGVYKRDAYGNWSALGQQAPLFIDRLRVASLGGGKLRFYQSAVVGSYDPQATDPARYVVRVSNDLAATWIEHEVAAPYAAIEGQALRLEAVDPSNPDRLLFSVLRDNAPDDVLVSFDQGKTLSKLAQVSGFGGATFAPDGRLWFGDAGELADTSQLYGLWFARNLESVPKPISRDYAVRCVSYQAATDTLFVCQPYAFGAVDPTSGVPGVRFELAKAANFASCTGVDLVGMCKAQLLRGYCGVTHFPEAPLCKPYGVLDSVAGCVSGVEAGCSAPLAGAAGNDGAPLSADAGTAIAAAHKPAAARDQPAQCSVSDPGRTGRVRAWSAPSFTLFGLLVCAFSVRRRARTLS